MAGLMKLTFLGEENFFWGRMFEGKQVRETAGDVRRRKETKMNGREEGLEVIYLLRVTRLTWLGVCLPSIYQNHIERVRALESHEPALIYYQTYFTITRRIESCGYRWT
jgi:hypothetical protein